MDAHAESVKSGLQVMPDDVTAERSTADFGRYEKFGWPHTDPPR